MLHVPAKNANTKTEVACIVGGLLSHHRLIRRPWRINFVTTGGGVLFVVKNEYFDFSDKRYSMS